MLFIKDQSIEIEYLLLHLHFAIFKIFDLVVFIKLAVTLWYMPISKILSHKMTTVSSVD